MKTLLVPLDGSAIAEQVLPFVRLLAPILTTKVHLLVVITDAQKQHQIAHFAAAPSRAAGGYETDWHWERRAQTQLAHAAQAYLDEQALALRATGLEVTFEVTSGEPAERIVDIAANEPQALIAMATQGYSGLQRWTLGSVADKVIQATQTLILMVRAATQPPPGALALRRILVPLDGSALAEQALPLAITLAVRAQAELLLFHVVRPFVAAAPDLLLLRRPPPPIDFPTLEHQQALQLLAGVTKRWHPPEIAVLPMVTSGEPAQEIVDTAANEHADLIVMATHGYTGVRRWALAVWPTRCCIPAPLRCCWFARNPRSGKGSRRYATHPDLTCIGRQWAPARSRRAGDGVCPPAGLRGAGGRYPRLRQSRLPPSLHPVVP